MMLRAPDAGAGSGPAEGTDSAPAGAPAGGGGGKDGGAPGAGPDHQIKDTLLTAPPDDEKSEPKGGQEGQDGQDQKADPKEGDQADTKPEKPEGYNLVFGEGVTIDKDILAKFQLTAHGLGLTKGQAQKLGDLYSSSMTDMNQKYQEAQIKALNDYIDTQNAELSKRPDFKQELALAKKTLIEFGSQDLIDVFRLTAMGSHPAMFDFMVKVGKALGEPGFKGGPGRAPESPLNVRIWGEDGFGPKADK
jgi:hypothetical protein